MAHDVFISYAAEDKALADMICAVVERQNVRCWIAPRDIPPGADWRESILSAIRGSRAMVLVFSAHANASKHVNREVECGIEAGIPVVPYRTQDVMPSGSLEYSLLGVHWLDAMTPPIEAHATRLAERLKTIVMGNPPLTQTVGDSSKLEVRSQKSEVKRDKAPRISPSVLAAAAVVVLIALAWFMFGRGPGETSTQTETTGPTPTAASASGSDALPTSAPDAPAPSPTSTSPSAPAADGAAASVAAAGIATPPNSGLVFRTPQAELLWSIKADHANDFEQTWAQLVGALRQSEVPQARQVVRSLTLARLPATAGSPLYLVRIEPALSNVDYSPNQLLVLDGRFDARTADSLSRRISDSVTQLHVLQLEPVDLVTNMSLNPLPAVANPAMPPGNDEYTMTADQAEIWWQLKPDQRDEFESVFREIFPGLVHSGNPYVRQMARGIKVFHVPGDAGEIEIFRIDSVAKRMSYNPAVLMQHSGAFAAGAQTALLARLAGAVAQVNIVPMTPVR